MTYQQADQRAIARVIDIEAALLIESGTVEKIIDVRVLVGALGEFPPPALLRNVMRDVSSSGETERAPGQESSRE
jgi:hypothetical protein